MERMFVAFGKELLAIGSDCEKERGEEMRGEEEV